MEYLDHINQMKTISQAVNTYIHDRLYLMDISEDDVTDLYVMMACYRIILSELKQLGIFLSVDEADIFEDYYTTEHYFYLRKIFDGIYLYDLFKAHPDIKDDICNILETSESEDHSDTVHIVLDYLISKYPNRYEIERAYSTHNNIYSNIGLKKHILAIAKTIIPTYNIEAESIPQINEFIKYVNEGRIAFKEAVNKVLIKDTSLDKAIMESIIRNYDMDKLAIKDISKLSWAVLTDPNTLNSDMKKMQIDLIKMHEERNTHHISYYLVDRERSITKENLVELVCHHFEPNISKDNFWKEVNNMLNTAFKNKLFTDDQIKYINYIADIVISKD